MRLISEQSWRDMMEKRKHLLARCKAAEDRATRLELLLGLRGLRVEERAAQPATLVIRKIKTTD